jgi:hypothetical protein
VKQRCETLFRILAVDFVPDGNWAGADYPAGLGVTAKPFCGSAGQLDQRTGDTLVQLRGRYCSG